MAGTLIDCWKRRKWRCEVGINGEVEMRIVVRGMKSGVYDWILARMLRTPKVLVAPKKEFDSNSLFFVVFLRHSYIFKS